MLTSFRTDSLAFAGFLALVLVFSCFGRATRLTAQGATARSLLQSLGVVE
jgi:hypothetical protein